MKHPEGLFGWVDTMSSDPDRSKAFYCELFGWTADDRPTPMGPVYTMFSKDGKLVAGLGPMPPGVTGMPSVWNSYALVGNVDSVLANVPAAGGKVLMPGMDVMDQGRMAMVQDPAGAVIGLWQPAAHEGAELFNAPGALTWNELHSRDLRNSLEFYTRILGWVWVEGPQTGYVIAEIPGKVGEDKSNCGAMDMPPGVPDEAPSYWMVYFAVSDCDATMAKAEELGGSVLFPAMDMGPGRFGGLVDPTGAMFAVGSFGSPDA